MLNQDIIKLILDNLSIKDCFNCLRASKQFHVYQFSYNDIIKGFKYCFEYGLKFESRWWVKKMCSSCDFNSGNLHKSVAEEKICRIFSNTLCNDHHHSSQSALSLPFTPIFWSEYMPTNIFKIDGTYLISDSKNPNYLTLMNLFQTISNNYFIQTSLKCRPMIALSKNCNILASKFSQKLINVLSIPDNKKEFEPTMSTTSYSAIQLRFNLSNITELNNLLIFFVDTCHLLP